MTNEVKTLTDEQGKVLAQAYSEYKAAEAKFKLLKDQLTKDIANGKHVTKYAIVNKIVKHITSVDYKQACIDNQVDLTEYTTEKEADNPTITIQPLVVESAKKSLLDIF